MDNGREDKLPWIKWYWQDWKNEDGLQLVSLAARGLWVTMLSVMASSRKRGFLLLGNNKMSVKDLANLTRISEKEALDLLVELREKDVFSETKDGIIYNRRMAREAEISSVRAECGRHGGRPKSKMKAKLKQNESKVKAVCESKTKAPSASASAYASASSSEEGGGGGRVKFEARHLELAKFLEEKVRENVPYHKFTGTNYLESWAREFRLMEDRDKISFQNIKSVLERSLEDEFWRINILSAGTFREKFGRLAAKIKGNIDNRRQPDPPQVGKFTPPPAAEKELRAEYEAARKKYMATKGYKTEDDIPFSEEETFGMFKARKTREADRREP